MTANLGTRRGETFRDPTAANRDLGEIVGFGRKPETGIPVASSSDMTHEDGLGGRAEPRGRDRPEISSRARVRANRGRSRLSTRQTPPRGRAIVPQDFRRTHAATRP